MSPSCLLMFSSVSHHHKKTPNKKEEADADPVVMWWSTQKGDWNLGVCPSPSSSSSSSSSSAATTVWLLHRRTKRRIPLPDLKEQHEIPEMAAKLSVKVVHSRDPSHPECHVTLLTATGRPPSLWFCNVVVGCGAAKKGCKVCARGGGNGDGGGGWSHYTYGGGRGWKEYGAGSRATTSSTGTTTCS